MNRLHGIIATLCIFTLPLFSGDRIGLVIGNDQYDNLGKSTQLDVAVRDAELMAKTLRSLIPPFEVVLLKNATQNEMEDAIDTFVESSSNSECALIYFAGHGVEYHGHNYLLMKDTKLSKISPDIARMKRKLGNEAISLQMMVDELDATEALVKIVILDACRNNPLKIDSGQKSRALIGKSRGLAQVTPPSGTLIAYSADAGQEANDGLFTEVLCQNLTLPGISLLEVFATTREQVVTKSTLLASQNRGVRHEPAEYTKLNRAGTKFSFLPGKNGTPSNVSNEIIRMRKLLEDAERKRRDAEAKLAGMNPRNISNENRLIPIDRFEDYNGSLENAGFVNMDYLAKEVGALSAISKKLDDEKQILDTELTALQRRLQALMDDAVKNKEKSEVATVNRELETQFQNERKKAADKIQDSKLEMIHKFRSLMKPYLLEVARSRGFDQILYRKVEEKELGLSNEISLEVFSLLVESGKNFADLTVK